jgi:hypothetical protein
MEWNLHPIIAEQMLQETEVEVSRLSVEGDLSVSNPVSESFHYSLGVFHSIHDRLQNVLSLQPPVAGAFIPCPIGLWKQASIKEV